MGESYTINYKNISGIPVIEILGNTQTESQKFIIGYHGWTNVKESIISHGLSFAKKGYHVILPDAFLHGERRPENYTYNPETDLPNALVHNVNEFEILGDYLRKTYQVETLSIFGTSMGGMTASLIIAKYGELLSGAAQYIAAIDVVKQIALLNDGKFKSANQVELSASERLLLDENLDFIKKYNLADNRVQLATVPFYAYNGGADDWIDTGINRRLIPEIQEKYPQADISYSIFETEDHWVPPVVIDESVQFLDAHLRK